MCESIWQGAVQDSYNEKYDTITAQYSTVQYSTVQYSTVQYSTVQYNTIQHSTNTIRTQARARPTQA